MGDIWSWGLGDRGQNGNEIIRDTSLPLRIHDVDGSTNVFGQNVTIDSAWTMSQTIIAKDTVGDIWSWGYGEAGQNGDGEVENNYAPKKIHDVDGTTNVFGQGVTIDSAWTMYENIIAKDTTGDVWSWGSGSSGQNGDGESAAIKDSPTKITEFNSTNTIDEAWTMSRTIIAKDIVGDIWSWGYGINGQNGDGESSNNLLPIRIHDVDGTTNVFGQGVTIDSAWTMSNTIIAKDTIGDVWSWGRGNWGQLGNGGTVDIDTPEKITEFNNTNTIVNAWTMGQTIIVKDSIGDVWSWGRGNWGQLGNGGTVDIDTPEKITEFNSTNTIEEAWTMDNTIIVKDTIGDVWVWGYGQAGQLGNGGAVDIDTPEKITEFNSTNTIVYAWTMSNTIIAKDTNNDIWSWGSGIYGQNGDGDSLNNNSPEKIFPKLLNLGSIELKNVTSSSATVIAGGFENGTGEQEATKATLSYTPNGGESQTMDDDNLTDGVSFDLIDLTPSSTYNLSIQYYKDTTSIETPITSTLTTEDRMLSPGQISSSNISSTTATVMVDGFINGTGNQEANKATLTYGVTGGTDQIMDDNNLTNGVSFDLANLSSTTIYNLSIQYYKDSTEIGSPITSILSTNDQEALVQGNLVVSNVTATTATVAMEGFTNGTGDNLATKAILTYDVAGTRATLEDNNLADGVSFNLTGLTEGQNYNLSVAYQNSSDSQIGSPITPENPLVPQTPPSSGGGGLSTGAIIGIAAGVGGAVLIGGGVGGFFLYKKKRGF